MCTLHWYRSPDRATLTMNRPSPPGTSNGASPPIRREWGPPPRFPQKRRGGAEPRRCWVSPWAEVKNKTALNSKPPLHGPVRREAPARNRVSSRARSLASLGAEIFSSGPETGAQWSQTGRNGTKSILIQKNCIEQKQLRIQQRISRNLFRIFWDVYRFFEKWPIPKIENVDKNFE